MNVRPPVHLSISSVIFAVSVVLLTVSHVPAVILYGTGDPSAKTFLEGVRGWVSAHDVGSMPNNSAFVGSFALSAAYDQTALDAAVTSWLSSNGDDNPYFQGTLRVLYLLAAAGNFPSTL